MQKFKVGDLLFDTHYRVVARLIDPVFGEATLIDELYLPGAEICLMLNKCRLATQEEIEKAYNEPTTQWERLCNTQSQFLDHRQIVVTKWEADSIDSVMLKEDKFLHTAIRSHLEENKIFALFIDKNIAKTEDGYYGAFFSDELEHAKD
jgi:hypothetical protein